jgi:hypothetical protein
MHPTQTMRSASLAIALLIASVGAWGDSSLIAKRDAALANIQACLTTNQVSSRACKKFNPSIKALTEVYRAGDKSVLPTLLQFTYLTDFFDEALLADPDGFLNAVAALREKDKLLVAKGLAGGDYRPLSKDQFDKIRALLVTIPDSSPVKEVARVCLYRLEVNNASLFINYFPAQTFNNPAGKFDLYWYSKNMYALGEKPLWPASENETTYRFTYLGAFTGSKVATLTVNSDGTGVVKVRILGVGLSVAVDEAKTVRQDQVTDFLTRLQNAHVWQTPTVEPRFVLDGAEWILEGADRGTYHVAVRSSPDFVSKYSPGDKPFAEAARLLFDFADHPLGKKETDVGASPPKLSR